MESIVAKPVAYANVPKTPSTNSKKDDSLTSITIPRYTVHVRLYVQETGTEKGPFSGTGVEIRGNMAIGTKNYGVYADLPEKTNFAGENNGLGRIVADGSVTTAFGISNFSGTLYEEGNSTTGNRIFTSIGVDWGTAPLEWANGGEWWFTQTVNNDQNFKGHLWWQVYQ